MMHSEIKSYLILNPLQWPRLWTICVARKIGRHPTDLQLNDHLEYFLRSPVYAVIVTLSIAWLGIEASLEAPELRDAKFVPFRFAEWRYTPTLFLFLLIATALLFWGQRWAKARARERTQRDRERLLNQQKTSLQLLNESTESIRREVRTMPPEFFLDDFGSYFRVSEDALTTALKGPSPDKATAEALDDLEEGVHLAIEVVLTNVLKLTRSFDSNISDRYSANIMIYLPTPLLNGRQRGVVTNRMKLNRDEVHVESLRGVLDLREDLMAHTASKEATGKGDPDLDPIAFALPKKEHATIEVQDGRKALWRTLPGAPQAFLSESTQVFGSTDEIEEWFENKGDLSPGEKKMVRAYLGSREKPRIGSFMSGPLVLRFDEHPLFEPDLPMGVVNINRASEGLLRDEPEASEYFTEISHPFRVFLARLIYRLGWIESEKYGTWKHLVGHSSEEKRIHTPVSSATSNRIKDCLRQKVPLPSM